MKSISGILTGYVAIALFFGVSYNKAISQPLYEPAPGPYSKLTTSGKANAQIIIPAEPSYLEEFAASELQKYIEKMSDVKLPISNEGKSGRYAFSFFLGKTKKASDSGIRQDEEKMGRDGFELRSVRKGLIIQGRNDLGTLFGVYELLERYFDVRWFMPGEEYYPRNTNLKIGRINLIYKPSFANRWVGHGEWPLHQRMNAYVTAGGKPVGINWKWHFHTFYTLMPPHKYYASHPEYYAMVNGKRTVTDSKSHGNQLCTSNPDVIRELTRNLIDTLDKEPGIEIITLSPNDGGGFCECENCRALDEPGRDWFARYSNHLAVFNKEVSRAVKMKHPNVLIKVGAYAMYARPPLNPDYRPEDNQIIQLCHLYFCHNHPLGSDLCKAGETYQPKDEFVPNQEFEKILDQWLKLSKHVFIYEYYSVGGMSRANLPWPMIHTMRADIPYYRNKGVEGFYTQQSDDVFYRLGLNFYLASKLCWNADLNVDALLDDYFEKFYGPAAAPMKDFFMSMEKSMQDWNGCSSYGLQGVRPEMGIKIFTPELLGKMKICVTQAEKLSENDPVYSKHVAMARRVYDETDESVRNMKLKTNIGDRDYGVGQSYMENPVGGGKRYNNIISPTDTRIKFTVCSNSSTSPDGLIYALNHVSEGDIIYIADKAMIDLSGTTNQTIPDGITLASGRGRNGSPGGLIYTTSITTTWDVFIRLGNNVTLNGIRVCGPDGNPAGTSNMSGIRTTNHNGIVIENCEIFNFPFEGIGAYIDNLEGLSSPKAAWIHHNYIHNNQRNGFGYGVDVGLASALIEGNIFDLNRHHVAGNRSRPGAATTSYEVRYNLFMNVNNNSLVDCHGGNDSKAWGNPNDPDVNTAAGGTLLIHHNTFIVSDKPSIAIRGVPAVICKVFNNWTYVPDVSKMPEDLAFMQRLENVTETVIDGRVITGKEYIRMQVYNNKYGYTNPVIY